MLDVEQLADLLGVSPVTVRRYAAGSRAVPDDVAARIHWLALLTADLAGAYNGIGIRRWFERPRSQLGGRSPRQLLRRGWNPEQAQVERVRQLATALAGPGGAT